MNIRLFNRPCTLRRFEPPEAAGGYLTDGYRDRTVSLHLFPDQSDGLEAPEAGARRRGFLAGRGEIELFPADQNTGRRGDLVYWNGAWYECVSAVFWGHTLLSHWDYRFRRVPQDGAGPALATPRGEEDGHDAD